MIAKKLVCMTCKKEYDIGPMFDGCPDCRQRGVVSPVEVVYDYNAVKAGLDLSAWLTAPRSIWKYRDLLPLSDPAHAVTLGEGGTPLVQIRTLNEASGLESLYVKNETCNPTWSFKDRQNAVSVSMARELGFKKVTTSTTGNQGVSTAAYAAAAGLECAVFCHPEAPRLQHDLIRFYGARSVSLKDRKQFLSTLVRDYGFFPCTGLTPLPVASPFGIEGYKTISYEIVMQLNGRVPDRIYAPVAGGHGIYGIYKGFRELKALSVVDRIPRMFGCQAEGCNPYVRSFQARQREVTTVKNPSTIALSIRDETGGDCGLRAIYDSDGAALDVSDPEIIRTAGLLARGGVAAEPASVAPVACALQAARAGQIGPRELVVCFVTGTAAKWPEALDRMVKEPIIHNPNFEELKLALWL
ncbi:MAG: pyridoxal-phosphate dependent enzyme [Candidatus Latescibacteria bacterium]|nr:pyridoxal-phosphate dependent enzyme [Candidatus Latescibacterota bacterium]